MGFERGEFVETIAVSTLNVHAGEHAMIRVGIGRRLAATLSVAGILCLGLSSELPAQTSNSGSDTQPSGPARVLVAPLHVNGGGSFGRKVSDKIRVALKDFPGLRSVGSKEIKAELKQLKLKEEDLGLVQWRQLAARMNVQIVMYGTVVDKDGMKSLDVTFVDAKSGDELKVPPFTVPGMGGSDVQLASDKIVEAFREQVKYRQSIVFCADYLASDQYEDALRNCNKALELNAGSSRALYLRGRVYMGQENWKSAIADLDRVIAENPANMQALQSAAYTNAQMGNMERATELYREYLNFNPDDADVRLNVAFNLANAGGYDAAIGLLKEGIAHDSSNAALWEFLGNVALNKGTRKDSKGEGSGSGSEIADEASVRLAVQAYNRVLTLKGDSIDPAILKNVIAANLALGDLGAALDFAGRAQKMLPNDPALWSMRADVLGRLNRFDEAISALDRTLALDPDYPNAHVRRGLFKLRVRDPDGAVVDLQAAVKSGTDPNVVAGQLLARAHADYFLKGSYSKAVEIFKHGLDFAKAGPVRSQLNFFIAYGYYQQGVQIDKRNEDTEACTPARRALGRFQQVMPYLSRAGSIQKKSQGQISESTDVYIYRQQQIIKKACKG